MKSLALTTIYSIYSKNKVLDLKKFVADFNPKKDIMDLQYLNEQLEIIRKRFNFPMKNNIIQEIAVNNTIRFHYGPYKQPLPSFIPAVLVNDRETERLTALASITRLVTKYDEAKMIAKIEPLKLYSAAVAAYTLLKYKQLEAAITVSQPILISGSKCYSAMMSKTLDKDYAINVKPEISDRVKFLAALFFLVNVMGKTDINDNLIHIAMKSTSISFTDRVANELAKDPDLMKACKNLETFFAYINEKVLFNNQAFSIRAFIQSYLKLYGPNTLFSLEYAPYFLWTIFNTAMSLGMNNQFVLDPLLGKDSTEILTAFSNLMR